MHIKRLKNKQTNKQRRRICFVEDILRYNGSQNKCGRKQVYLWEVQNKLIHCIYESLIAVFDLVNLHLDFGLIESEVPIIF